MLHHRLLTWFLNVHLLVTIKKHHFVSLFLWCMFYFVEQIRKCATERNKRSNLWSLQSLQSPFFLILSNEGPNIYDVDTDRGWGGLEICHMFTDSVVFKQHIYCLFLQMKDRWLGLVCKCHNCIISNIKIYFDKKVLFLALVPVL